MQVMNPQIGTGSLADGDDTTTTTIINNNNNQHKSPLNMTCIFVSNFE